MTAEDGDDADFTDVGLVNIGGERHLFLKPQPFDTAVRQVSSALPELPLEQVERLLREHPEFKAFEELMELAQPGPPVDITPLQERPLQPVRSRARLKRLAIAASLTSALVGSWALGYATADHTAGSSANDPAVRPSPSSTSAPDTQPAPFVDSDFLDFSEAGRIDCQPIANLQAECTDADGMVMSTKAATGPDSTIFTFAYGREQIGLRIFYDAAYAKTWSRQDGSREMYEHIQRHGRYVLWGTDTARIGEYMKLLKQADKGAGPHTMGQSTPLPPRLAALTLGTLGLDGRQVHQIIARSAASTADAPSMVAARLVLGLDMTPVFSGPDHEDIVALAIGIERPPAAGGSAVLVTTPEQPAQTTTPAPPTDAIQPVKETPPPVTDPASSPPEGTITPPVQDTPPPAEAPVGDTPAPVEVPPVEATPSWGDNGSQAEEPHGQERTPNSNDQDQEHADDLLIVRTAWTVPAGA
ncbi:hypothetical protein ACIQVL_03735 [Streptomyces sp. NPDC090499]|uniref:hypothetical protein n=1 Tax=Streptomyces sp. NPDC090499 TaxID=3365965 RepID=UPI0038073EA4